MASPSLEISPENELEFVLSTAETTSKATMTFKHPGSTEETLAFKVKTTQPRRYLVRPNQGLVKPGGTETVQILLVEKDKLALLQSYQRLGQSALDHSKDKFLVQACAVSPDFVNQHDSGGAGYDALTQMWSTATASGSQTPVSNKKLQVKHKVAEHAAATAATSSTTEMPERAETSSMQAMEKMSHEQLLAEIANLRRKYDELVAFSVNLTAERDILNNTLEQTKRDLNREVAKGAAQDNKRGSLRGGAGAPAEKAVAGTSWLTLFMLAFVFMLVGIRMEQLGKTEFLQNIPVLGKMFDGSAATGGSIQDEL